MGCQKHRGETYTIAARLREIVQTGIAMLIASAANLDSAAESKSTTDSLILKGSTVVLVSGLPGDIESENVYNDYARNWLSLLSDHSENYRSIYALSDNPEALNTTAAKATVLKADRKSFMDLAKSVSTSTNPLVVIAWGHGGRQGPTPVFHVRGERLTPDDFAVLAPKAANVPSRWILMFRTSGAFASRIAAAGREIISSEAETMFTSDPIGMELLISLVKANPSAPFPALTDDLGRETTKWYEQRHLARTEEPALWWGLVKPRLLAGKTNTTDMAEAEPEGEVGAIRTSQFPSRTTHSLTNLPEKWRALHTVDPAEYPDADGVVLRREVSYTLGSNPAVSAEHEEYIQILTLEGKRLADFDVSYAPPFEDISFLDCEVLQPGGNLVRLDPDAIREARESSVEEYHLGSRKFFSLPGVGPGAVLHVRYRIMQKTFPLPHFSMALPVNLDLPAVESTLRISLPKDSAVHFALENTPAVDPAIQQGSYASTYTWTFTNLHPHLPEALTAPNQEPRLAFSTFPDWRAFAEWYGRISQLADEVTPEIKDKALELTRNATSDRDKIVALYNFVTGLRYVAVPLGINSLRPHAAAKVLSNQYGDCKDKANLFNALLRCVNIDAHLVLVPRFSQAHESIPGLAFNHAISQIVFGTNNLWVDTTDDVCRFGMLPPGDPGRKVLVIDGKSSSLTALPLPPAMDHRLKLRSSLNCSGLNRPIETLIEVSAAGFPDYQLRTAARQAKEHHGESIPLLLGGFRPSAGSFSLQKQNATSASALDEDFLWHANGQSIGVCSQSSGTGKWLIRAPFWIPMEWDIALNDRKFPLFLNQGYPLLLDQEVEFRLPADAKMLACPEKLENKKPPLLWQFEWKPGTSGKVVARLSAELQKGELSESESTLARDQLTALYLALAAGPMVGAD